LQRELRSEKRLAEWLEFARSFHERLHAPRRLRRRFSIAPSQVDSEVLAFLGELAVRQTTRFLEVGTGSGGSLFLAARAAAWNATLVSVDLPHSPGNRGYPPWKEKLYREFATAGQSVRLIRADSHTEETLRQVREVFGGEPVDAIFIDGDHSYDGVRRDYELYAPLVRPGGLVAFHDIVPDHRTRYGRPTANHSGDVPRFWRELRRNRPHREIVEDYAQDGYGIGILLVAREAAW